jgi:hypothetical protein
MPAKQRFRRSTSSYCTACSREFRQPASRRAVADLVAAMAEADCRFLGSATPSENIDAVSI